MKTTRKTRFIENLYTLSAGEKKEITDFFTKYPNYENHIDWNSTSLLYQDFEKTFTLAENSLRNIKRKTKADPRLLFESHNCEIIGQTDDFLIVVPLDWKCAAFFNSFDCGGEGAHWCIGNSNDAERWNSYQVDKNVFFLIFFINKHPVFKRKVIIQYHVKDDKHTLWLQDNTESNQIPSPLDTTIELIKNSAEQLLPKISSQSYILEGSTLTKGYDHERIDIPVGVTAVGNHAFSECRSLKTITLPAGLVTIGDGAFYRCENLTAIDIPDSVTSIGKRAFGECKKLGVIDIPAGVTTIGDGAFCRCNNLTCITVKEKNQSFIDVDGVLFDMTKNRILCYPAGKKDIRYMIPDGVTVIDDFAFFGCENLEVIDIPKSITTIVKIFSDCKNISNIIVGEKSPFFTDVDGIVFDKAKNRILCYPVGRKDIRYTVPDGVTVIDDFAFYECKNLKAINISAGVTAIGYSAFLDCESLATVNILGNVTAIGNNAFRGCKSLVSINMPVGITTIGDRVFEECKNLATITLPTGLVTIGDSAFCSCENLMVIDIPDSVTAIGKKAFFECESLATITLPPSLSAIKMGMFGYCKSLTTIDIPESVITIDFYAFYECENLTAIDIPKSVTIIGNGAFYRCKSLATVNIPESVIAIGDIAFRKRTSLTTINIPESITVISGETFSECESLRSIDIPAGVTTIGQSAFLGCENLEAVYLHRKTSILKNAFGNTQAKIFYKD